MPKRALTASPSPTLPKITPVRLLERAAPFDVVAKRTDEPYADNVRWVKVKNPGYSQAVARGEEFQQTRTPRTTPLIVCRWRPLSEIEMVR